MTTEDFITELFCLVDDKMGTIRKHPQARLHPSELVTLGLLFTLKGVGNRAFYCWLIRDYRPLFPQIPERTRLFRFFSSLSLRSAFELASLVRCTHGTKKGYLLFRIS